MFRTQLLLVFAVLILTTACNARFKKFARAADSVSVNVVVTGSPHVNLNGGGGIAAGTQIGALADAAMSTATSVESAKVQKRLVGVIRPEEVRGMVKKGAVEGIGNGPPFGTAEKSVDGTIEIAVQSYGIVQSGGGPTFYVDYLVRAYRASDNKRVYSNNVSCSDRLFSVLHTPGNIASTVATVSHLNKMSDEEIHSALQMVVQRCTGFLVAEMRDDAG